MMGLVLTAYAASYPSFSTLGGSSSKAFNYLPRYSSTGSIIVDEAAVASALKGSSMKTLQGGVSLPAIERYVRMLESGSAAPAIKVADDVIIEGNHRYVAGRIFGKEPESVPWAISPSQQSRIKPVNELKIDPTDWGNK